MPHIDGRSGERTARAAAHLRNIDPQTQRQAGFGASAPRVARWLGDIRASFPVSVVQVMQKDAIERLGLTRLLLEPEMLEAVEPDVHLVGTLLSLSQVMPEQARESARAVVRTVTRDLERRLSQRTRSAVTGALNRASRTNRPRRPADIDWNRTIRVNLRNYLPEHRTVVPERLVGSKGHDLAELGFGLRQLVLLQVGQSPGAGGDGGVALRRLVRRRRSSPASRQHEADQAQVSSTHSCSSTHRREYTGRRVETRG